MAVCTVEPLPPLSQPAWSDITTCTPHTLPSLLFRCVIVRCTDCTLYTVHSALYLEAVAVLLEALPAVPGWHLLPLLLHLAMVRIVACCTVGQVAILCYLANGDGRHVVKMSCRVDHRHA